MLKVLKRVLLSLLAVVIVYALVLWSEVLPRPTETQREALALMEQAPGAQSGGNAFVFFWQIAYDIPEAERESALAADAASFAQWQPAEFDEGFEPPSHTRYPRLIALDDPALNLCEEDGVCLEALTAQAGDRLLAGKEAVLERLADFAGMTFWRHHFGDSSVDALPADIGLRRLRWAYLAVRFTRGETESALHGVCSDIAAWRRLRTNSDTLIASSVAQRGLMGSLRLYLDMRARLPAEAALPASCAELQTPPTLDERMACNVFQGEFKLVSDPYNDPPQTRQMRIWRRSDDAGSRWNWRLLVNDSHSRHLVAERYARHCRANAAPLADWAELPASSTCSGLDRLFNPMGCMLEDIARPADYRSYSERDRDAEGALRLVALAEWLSRQAEPHAAMAARPEAHRAFEHAIALEGDQLVLTRLGRYGKDQEHWRIPLPGSAVAKQD